MIKKDTKEETIKEIYQQQIEAPRSIVKSTGNFKILLLCLIISLCSGFVAGLVSDTFFDTNLVIEPSSPSQQKQNVPNLESFLSKEDQNYNKVLSQLKSQIVGFYKKRVKAENILDSLYLEKDFLGSGVVVTSDGWLLTHKQVVDNQDFVVITADKKVLEPLKKVIDPLTNVVLVQI
jgi:S1-C subfamily serine protease